MKPYSQNIIIVGIILTCLGQLSGCAAAIGVGALGVTSSAYDRRSLGHQIDDKTIEWKLKKKPTRTVRKN